MRFAYELYRWNGFESVDDYWARNKYAPNQTVVALVDYMPYVCLYTICIYFVYLDTALKSLILDLTVTCIIILLNQYIYIYIWPISKPKIWKWCDEVCMLLNFRSTNGSPTQLFSTLMILKAACMHNQCYIDRLITTFMKVLHKMAREHLQPTSTETSPSKKFSLCCLKLLIE